MTARRPFRQSDIDRLIKIAQKNHVGIAGIELRPDGSVFIRAGDPLDKREAAAKRDPRLKSPEEALAELKAWAQ